MDWRKILTVFFLILVVGEAYAQFSLSGHIQNFALFKTDRDFDPSDPLYEPWGDTAGVIGTYAEPRLRLVSGDVILLAEPLVGFNIWSRNFPKPRIGDEKTEEIIVFLRQLYSEVKLNSVTARAGYQYFADPIGIFIRHWIGGASLRFEKFRISVGQIPDQTFEGISVFSNNFINDTFMASIEFMEKRAKDDINVLPLVDAGLFGGLYAVFDNSIVGKQLFVATLVAGYRYDSEKFSITSGLALQGGLSSKSAERLKDERMLAGAVEIAVSSKGKEPVGGEVMLLSPDNSTYRDGLNTSFLYSGRSLSRTLQLTEDEIIFRGDNLDINIGERISGFYNIRPGLIVLDIWKEIDLLDSLSITPIAGGAFCLSKENSSTDDSILSYIFGVEISPVISWKKENVLIELANSLIMPGKASTTFFNPINPYRKRPLVWSVLLSLKVML